MKRLRMLALIFGLIGQAVMAQSIQIITIGSIPISNVGNEQVYYVDAVARFQAKMSEGLSKNPEEAAKLLQQRMNKLPKDYTKPLQNAGDGLALALRHHINRVPAIVFDDKAVVYGITDLALARQHYQQWLRQIQPSKGRR